MTKVESVGISKVMGNAGAGWQALVGLMLVGWQGAVNAADGDNFGLGSDFLSKGQGLVASGASTMSTIIIGVGVVWIGWMTISKFQEWRNGKADIGEVGVVAFGGSALLLFIAFLFNKATTVFGTAATSTTTETSFIFDGSVSELLSTVVQGVGPVAGLG